MSSLQGDSGCHWGGTVDLSTTNLGDRTNIDVWWWVVVGGCVMCESETHPKLGLGWTVQFSALLLSYASTPFLAVSSSVVPRKVGEPSQPSGGRLGRRDCQLESDWYDRVFGKENSVRFLHLAISDTRVRTQTGVLGRGAAKTERKQGRLVRSRSYVVYCRQNLGHK